MKPTPYRFLKAGTLFLLLLVLVPAAALRAGNSSKDSLRIKEPKHYTRPNLYYNLLVLPERRILGSSLGNIRFQQSNLGFSFPMLTKTWHKNDTLLPAFQLLGNINLLGGHVQFTSPADRTIHRLKRGSIGLRGIYTNGQKNSWFVAVSPFVAQDNLAGSAYHARLATVIIYNRTVSRTFSYRLGYCKSFVFGNNFHLPIIGFRFGPLDGTYMNIQLLRNISLNFPIGEKCKGSVFVKPVGGVYTIKNTNPAFSNSANLIQFGRYDLLSGFQLTCRASRNFSFYGSSGVASSGNLTFLNNRFKNTLRPESPFKRYRTAPTLFLNVGFSWYFGKSKSISNNYQVYDALDMNNTFDPGDSNLGAGNHEIPNPSLKARGLQYKDIQDLVNEEDLY